MIKSASKFLDGRLSKENLLEMRYNHVKEFFNQRGLRFEDVSNLVSDYYQEGDTLLITSSPVYGLATDKSDIDLVLIGCRNGGAESSRTPLTVYEGNNRFDVYRIDDIEISTSLDQLDRIAASPIDEIFESLARWDSLFAGLPKKEFERLINGITFTGEMPHLGHLPQLSYVWMIELFYASVRFDVYTLLAQKGQMFYAALGYLLNGIMYLMGTVMAYHGHVFSNKKQYLWAWKIFAKSCPTDFNPLKNKIDKLFSTITEGFSDVSWENVNRCVIDFNEILEQVADQMELDILKQIRIKIRDYTVYPLLKDLWVIDGNGRRCLSKCDMKTIHFDAIKPLEIGSSDMQWAKEILNMFRMGILSLDYEREKQ